MWGSVEDWQDEKIFLLKCQSCHNEIKDLCKSFNSKAETSGSCLFPLVDSSAGDSCSWSLSRAKLVQRETVLS